jgi:hypothetical protein
MNEAERRIQFTISEIKSLNDKFNNPCDFSKIFELFYNFTKYYKFLSKGFVGGNIAQYEHTLILEENKFCKDHGEYKIIMIFCIDKRFGVPKIEIRNEYKKGGFLTQFEIICIEESTGDIVFGFYFYRTSTYFLELKHFKTLITSYKQRI